MFSKVLVANRGEIAARVIGTLKRLGIRSVAVHSDADRFTRPVLMADGAVRLGPAPAAESYLDVDAVLAACRATGDEAVHPGYGLLFENAGFAERLAAAGLALIGPRPGHIRTFGLKHAARARAAASGVPLLPGTGLLADVEEALREAERIGYPVMLKSSAGGASVCSSAGTRRSSATGSRPCGAAPRRASATRACSWSASWRRRATSRCRSSAMGPAASWRSASATAPSSAATGRSSRRRRPRTCPRRHPRASTPPRWRSAAGSPTCRPARWSSSTTRRGTTSPSSKSTRGSRSSTASPRPCWASTSWSGWCARPRARTSSAGRLREIRAVPGRTVRAGDVIAIIEEDPPC